MLRISLGGVYRPRIVDRFAKDIHDATQGRLADRRADDVAGVDHRCATDKSVRGIHRNRADIVIAQMLSHFQRKVSFLIADGRVR